jgi:hypothetical protein
LRSKGDVVTLERSSSVCLPCRLPLTYAVCRCRNGMWAASLLGSAARPGHGPHSRGFAMRTVSGPPSWASSRTESRVKYGPQASLFTQALAGRSWQGTRCLRRPPCRDGATCMHVCKCSSSSSHGAVVGPCGSGGQVRQKPGRILRAPFCPHQPKAARIALSQSAHLHVPDPRSPCRTARIASGSIPRLTHPAGTWSLPPSSVPVSRC